MWLKAVMKDVVLIAIKKDVELEDRNVFIFEKDSKKIVVKMRCRSLKNVGHFVELVCS